MGKSIASRRKFVPPSIKQKLFDKDISSVKQYVYDSVSTSSTASIGLVLNSQPKSLSICNTNDSVEFYVSVDILIPGGSLAVISRVVVPVGATLILDDQDVPINPVSKGVSIGITRKGSSGNATATAVATF